MLKYILSASLVGLAAAECPNACSGHGTCGAFDMCTCFRNWQAADCSQRTCPFDLAHVDTPKGDLNHDNSVSASNVISGSTVYPTGTTEKFPAMVNSANEDLTQTAHYYMECSNKGICDRSSGQCQCFDGYDGTACQRASCPNDCSGHGTCETISDLAYDEFQNVYALWDKDATMGCKCDSGYTAADCSQRTCKMGVDPLYIDDTVGRFATMHVRIEATANDVAGTYALKFYDVHGEDFETAPITYGAGNTECENVLAALAKLPNNAVHSSTICTQSIIDTDKGVDMRLKFVGNPGYLKPVEVNYHLDGARATLTGTALQVDVYTEVAGEFDDHFASKCSSVQATFSAQGTWADATPGSLGFVDNLSAAEVKLLKACLGDSDGDLTNNVDVFNWDYGALKEHGKGTNADASLEDGLVEHNVIGSHPHAIKAVPVDQSGADVVSELLLVWYDVDATAGEEFRLANLPADVTNEHFIHTTSGIVQQLGLDSAADGDGKLTAFANDTRVVGYFNQYSNKIYTNVDASCESTNQYANRLQNCVQKGDKLFVVDGCWGTGVATALDWSYFGSVNRCADAAAAARKTGNLFTVTKIYKGAWSASTIPIWQDTHADEVDAGLADGKEDRFVIEVDQNVAWDGSAIGNPDDNDHAAVGFEELIENNTGLVVLFKFTPAADGAGVYSYVSECSNRGACDRETGLCSCFKGYTALDCSVQSSLAV